MLKLSVNAEARRFSEPGAGIPHAGIFGGADGRLPVLRYLGNAALYCWAVKMKRGYSKLNNNSTILPMLV